MLPSTRASDFAELAPAASLAPPVTRQRSALRAVLSLPSGRVGAVLTAMTLTTAPLAPPTLAHLMGTDAIGRDVFSGVLHGARTSLFVAASVTLLAFVCGALVGMVAGWRGGLLDDLLMRVTELFQVVPRFFLVVVVVALLGPGIDRVVLTLGL